MTIGIVFLAVSVVALAPAIWLQLPRTMAAGGALYVLCSLYILVTEPALMVTAALCAFGIAILSLVRMNMSPHETIDIGTLAAG
jgi:hypothetical protein